MVRVVSLGRHEIPDTGLALVVTTNIGKGIITIAVATPAEVEMEVSALVAVADKGMSAIIGEAGIIKGASQVDLTCQNIDP